MKVFFHLIKGYKQKVFILILFTSLIFGIEAFFHPILLKILFDEGVIKNNFRLFIYVILFYLALGIVMNLSGFLVSLWNKSLQNALTNNVSRRMLEAYYNNKDYTYLMRKGEGYIMSRIYNDVSEGLIPFMELIKNITNSIIAGIVFLGVLFYLSWQATLILIGIVPLASYISKVFGRRIQELSIKEREYEGNFLSVLTPIISAFRIIREFNLHQNAIGLHGKKLKEYLKMTYDNYKLIDLYKTSTSLAMNISDFFSLFVGTLCVLRGILTFGGYLAFITAFWRAVTSFMSVFKSIADINKFYAVLNRLYEFETERIDKYYKEGENIVLENIDFSYENGRSILKYFSLEIRRGEKVLIAGPNGSGKTTLANIIAGHLMPSKGNVVLISKRSSVTLPIIFPPIKVEEIVKDGNILKKIGLIEVSDKLATELSIGEKQKLAITLALSKDADVYIFDEPLANIDIHSKDIVFDEILNKNKTLIVIMHDRKGYEKYFDRIISLEKRRNNEGVF